MREEQAAYASRDILVQNAKVMLMSARQTHVAMVALVWIKKTVTLASVPRESEENSVNKVGFFVLPKCFYNVLSTCIVSKQAIVFFKESRLTQNELQRALNFELSRDKT